MLLAKPIQCLFLYMSSFYLKWLPFHGNVTNFSIILFCDEYNIMEEIKMQVYTYYTHTQAYNRTA